MIKAASQDVPGVGRIGMHCHPPCLRPADSMPATVQGVFGNDGERTHGWMNARMNGSEGVRIGRTRRFLGKAEVTHTHLLDAATVGFWSWSLSPSIIFLLLILITTTTLCAREHDTTEIT